MKIINTYNFTFENDLIVSQYVKMCVCDTL